MGSPFDALLPRVRTPHKHGRLVLAPTYREGNFDSLAVDCPFPFRHDGRFYMTYVGFDGIGYRTGLASSGDLLAWRRERLLLDRGPAGSVTEFNVALTWILRENGLYSEGRLLQRDGLYVGTYHAYPRPGYEAGPAAIGICTSRDLIDWDLHAPCLCAGDGAEWERGGLYKSCLIKHEGTFTMFYNAKNRASPWVEQIGVATSRDLVRWERRPGNPVVEVGPEGAFDDVFVSDPAVFELDGTWVMFAYTLGSDGYARDSVAFSADLVHWKKSGEVLIDVGPPGSIDSRYAHKPGIIAHDGRLYHFYCAVTEALDGEGPIRVGDHETRQIRGISVATS